MARRIDPGARKRIAWDLTQQMFEELMAAYSQSEHKFKRHFIHEILTLGLEAFHNKQNGNSIK